MSIFYFTGIFASVLVGLTAHEGQRFDWLTGTIWNIESDGHIEGRISPMSDVDHSVAMNAISGGHKNGQGYFTFFCYRICVNGRSEMLGGVSPKQSVSIGLVGEESNAKPRQQIARSIQMAFFVPGKIIRRLAQMDALNFDRKVSSWRGAHIFKNGFHAKVQLFLAEASWVKENNILYGNPGALVGDHRLSREVVGLPSQINSSGIGPQRVSHQDDGTNTDACSNHGKDSHDPLCIRIARVGISAPEAGRFDWIIVPIGCLLGMLL